MQKLIIIRGHSGSGKSTFAHQKIIEFKNTFSNAIIYHIENDKYMIKDGVYSWTKNAYLQAKQFAKKDIQQAFQQMRLNPIANILLVISNVGANRREIDEYLSLAETYKIDVEIYRMQNFFRNQHNVSLSIVCNMYLDILATPLPDETLVPVVKPMSPYIKQKLQRISYFRNIKESK
ncbi:hypothetical protein HT667_01835 [Ursidibacter maritimus]|uniref:hypothetical protein n=1 Tax=Ursidibacter maritimus TaxID=1331689 RepID=UPI001C473EB7|nr:hypothetical protein [Ursidibacter maritimus]MBV6540216.1 hypothetical protein [Ursidibacter maritimus]